MAVFVRHLFILEVAMALVGTAAVRARAPAQLPWVAGASLTDALAQEDTVADKYECGQVPRNVLIQQGLIPDSWETLRCPRGQAGDAQPGEDEAPSEQEFLACGLVSTRKFVVWTPHVFLRISPGLKTLLDWARHHTTCEFALADKCNAGFLMHHGSSNSSSSVRCLPNFNITTQPTSKHALVDIAIKLFHATAEERGVEDLSQAEAEMAFGAVLGYPKYATQEFLENSQFTGRFDDFDKSYDRALSWILDQLKECCMNSEDENSRNLYTNIGSWAQTTGRRG